MNIKNGVDIMDEKLLKYKKITSILFIVYFIKKVYDTASTLLKYRL